MNPKKAESRRRSAARSSSKAKQRDKACVPAQITAQLLDLIGCPSAEACCRVNRAFPTGMSRSRGSNVSLNI
jgi:hypothetical protein